jgi:hypothetical protein
LIRFIFLYKKKTPYYSQDFSRPAIFRLTGKLLGDGRPINNTCIPMKDEPFKKDPVGSQSILITGGTGIRKTGLGSHQNIIE